MIVLNTLLYHGNASDLLRDDNWFLNYKSDLVSKKLITVNNVHDRNDMIVSLEAVKLKDPNLDYYFVEDYETRAIEYFKLDVDKNTTQGYYYIIPYFALILHLEKGFVFNVSDDCMKEIFFDDEFIKESIKEISNNDKIPVTTLGWGKPQSSFGYDVGEWEQIETFKFQERSEPEMEHFWHSIGFVDQVFIGSIDKLKNLDYNLTTYDNTIYHGPWYCPNSWERRVAEYMHKNRMYRGVWKNANQYYIHPGHKL
jgi:hypothetical protein